MSIRDDCEDGDRVQLTTTNGGGRASDFENVGKKRADEEGFPGNPLVVSSSTLEAQGESPKCMYHLMSPTVPAKTPVDPRFSTDKPPRVRMILPELNRGIYNTNNRVYIIFITVLNFRKICVAFTALYSLLLVYEQGN